MNDCISWRPLADHARALALAASPSAQWQAVSAMLADAFGHRLFTALLYLERHGLMKRIHTSNERISPQGGFKATGQGPWSQHVLQQGRIYVARDEYDVRTVFSEAPALIAQGLVSSLNIPVRHAGQVVGSLNLLAGRHAYDEADHDLAALIAGLCAPVFLQEVAAAEASGDAVDRTSLDSV